MPSPKQIPSLIARKQRTRNPNWRILQRLASGGQPATVTVASRGWTIDSWTIGLGMLLIVVCTAAWYLQARPIARPRPAPAPLTVVAPLAVPGPAAIAGAPEPPQAAQIISTSSAENTKRSMIPPPVSLAAPSKLAQGTSAQKATHRSEPGRDISPAATSKDSNDSDAALLAALVAHGNPPSSGGGINRDIVERHASDHTAQLLARCQQLGLIEGMLCRSRICADRWDSDRACRQPATPAIAPSP